MDKETRSAIERATQRARRLLEEDFAAHLESAFDVLPSGAVAPAPGAHLTAREAKQRERIVAAIAHKRAAGMTSAEAVADYVRDAAFTTLNRFAALKMLESRGLVQECVSKGEQSSGYREFCGLAPGVALLPDGAGYRLYVESLFDELSTEIKVLFDRRDPASVLWPWRGTYTDLLDAFNAPELAGVWTDDETIGWVYQYFNSGDERKKMREASQAPRNSRELAVRNQFFTPRYVVEFLVDNTLGRTWLEMHGRGSRLAEECRYFVRTEDDEKSTRPRKDPRDLRVLDPACGSGHFLLYAFDLLLTIYEEAWAAEEAPPSEATGRRLREDYGDLDDLRRATPALIVEHNLHGVDIDPRAAQIAALALWLRAQRAWKDLDVPAAQRHRISRTHIVVAEPMPGDEALVEEFACRLDPPLLRDLFRKMVAEMRLAGELGTLLPVEKSLAAELTRAREQFVKQREVPRAAFLPGMERPGPAQGALDLSGIDDDGFFHEAEARLLEALRVFAEGAGGMAGGASVRRRLFAGDAAQGIALIDLLRRRFDVVLTNPPFGAVSLGGKKEFEKAYPRTKNDVYAAFVERGVELLSTGGALGAITSRAGFFLSTFQAFREDILLDIAPVTLIADLGLGVMDAAIVEAAAYCLRKEAHRPSPPSDLVCIRCLEARDKAAALKAAVSRRPIRGEFVYTVSHDSLSSIPGSPFAYWASDGLRRLFHRRRTFSDGGWTAQVGASTKADFRFLRAWWEVSQGPLWKPFAKGGAYAQYYSEIHLLIKWGDVAREIDAYVCGRYEYLKGNASWVLHPESLYFCAGLTWTRRTKTQLSTRVLPAGCVFSDKGPAAFARDGTQESLLALLVITNSTLFRALVELQLAAGEPTDRGGVARSYEIGLLLRTPVPTLTPEGLSGFCDLALRSWSLRRGLDTVHEVSRGFALPALMRSRRHTARISSDGWVERVDSVHAELDALRAEADTACCEAYGIGSSEYQSLDVASPHGVEVGGLQDGVEDEDDEPSEIQALHGFEEDVGQFASWAVGVAFGRFDVRLATGERPMPPEPGPFDPLPACSPGMLTGDDGLPLACPPAGYPIEFPEAGVLVDDPGHPRDLTFAMRRVFDVVFGADADRWWVDVAAAIDAKRADLGAWLAGSFFEFHLKRYSKSRRKAPIYWQLATPSASYSVWLYAHRVTRDTFFQLRNDIVGPKLRHEEQRLAGLIERAGATPSAALRKEIAAQESFVEELRATLGEIKRVAPLWNPDLDDGIVLVMAPLWRLVPQHKAWQKELKSKWDELVAGKYDWAHLAMHLWPERVVPKCATDRSLAIAHGLEDEFWVEGADGKWKARTTSVRPIEELVRVRSSPAVKAALKSLLEAHASSGMRKNVRRGRTDA